MLELEKTIADLIEHKNVAPEGSAGYRLAVSELAGLRFSREEAGPIMEDLEPVGAGSYVPAASAAPRNPDPARQESLGSSGTDRNHRLQVRSKADLLSANRSRCGPYHGEPCIMRLGQASRKETGAPKGRAPLQPPVVDARVL